MLVLGIDTSSAVGALGLVDETGILGEYNIKLKHRHSERLLANIDQLLKESGRDIKEIQGIAVTSGPGSFTGLRIGISTVKTFVQVLDIPVIGLSTLDLLAYNFTNQHNWLVPVIDARRKRVYTSLYQGWQQDIRAVKKWEDQALAVDILLQKLVEIQTDASFILLGDGVDSYRETFLAAGSDAGSDIILAPSNSNFIRGSAVAELGRYYLKQDQGIDYLRLLPNYLKKPQAEVNWQKKHLSGDGIANND